MHAADQCIALLREGRALIEAIGDNDYADTAALANTSSTGAHIRHVLDFVDCLIDGLLAQRVDYAARKRRADVETNREAGCAQIGYCIEGLEQLRAYDGQLPLQIRSEPGQAWSRSSLARELQFVAAHIVHHHALISMILAQRGIEAPANFGVALSTLAKSALSLLA